VWQFRASARLSVSCKIRIERGARRLRTSGVHGERRLLDFRFLVGAVIVFVLTVVAGLRIFGASDPLLATMGDQPRVEAVALPRQVPPTKPNAPKIASPERAFVRPAAIEVPAARPPAKTVQRASVPEVTGAIDPAPLPEAEEAAKPRPKRAAAPRPKEPDVVNPFGFLFPFAQQK
jgi:hypothetical protein